MKYKLGCEKTCPGIAQNCGRCSKISTTTSADPDQTASKEASQIRVFLVCFSDKHFVKSSPNNHHFFVNRERKVFEILEH